MSEIEKFSELVQNARRDDDYINATKWTKTFKYRLDRWKQLPETKAKLQELSERTGIESSELIYATGRGHGSTTWVHPVMAVHLASYLDPAFANYVAEIFVRYVTADPHLAADIASRQETKEGLDIINEAVQKRYKFLEGRDYFYSPGSLDKAEMSYYAKRWGLPPKKLAPITLRLDFDAPSVLVDFLEENYPLRWLRVQRESMVEDDERFLLGYFKDEIDVWLKDKPRDE